MEFEFPRGSHKEVNEDGYEQTHPGYHASTCAKCLASYLVGNGCYDPGICGKHECEVQ